MTDLENKNFEHSFEVRWADLDPNQHVRHTVYADYAAQVRISYLSQHGFPPERFFSLKCGPILFEEKLRYLKEVRLGDQVIVNMKLQSLSQDGERWKIRHEVFKNQAESAAVIEVYGAWLDLKNRRLMTPPTELFQILQSFPRTEDYQEWQEGKKGISERV